MSRNFGEGEKQEAGVNVDTLEVDRMKTSVAFACLDDGGIDKVHIYKTSFEYEDAKYKDISIQRILKRTEKNYAGRKLYEFECEIRLLKRVQKIKLFYYLLECRWDICFME